ncbi:3'-5' exonuclease [Candidatus Uhrbacteria bacterium]|nr:3'-5' exonuclease [Candidatus Uhrbacteria bacterium]
MNLLFLDTETTGLGKEDRLIQLAYKLRRPISLDFAEPQVEYFRPPLPISFDAMATHHITNAMVEDKAPFVDSEFKKFLTERVEDSIFVAHNAPFDLRMLAAEGVQFQNFVDTQRVCMHLIDSPSYRLQYLRYSLDMRVLGTAHDAAGDVNVLVALFDHLYSLVEQSIKSSDKTAIIDRMMTLSTLPVLLKKFTFGKYINRTFEDVAITDKGYLSWLYSSEMGKMEDERNQDLLHTIKQYL